MKRLMLPLLLLGVAVALAASCFFFLIYLQKPKADEVVVARSDIYAGTTIDASMITSIPWEGRKFPDSFVSVKNKNLVLGKVACVDIVAGTPVTIGCLATKDSPSSLFAKIPEGMRAITVKVDEVSGVAGFSRPGSRVDVLLASTKEGPSTGEGGAKIILQNVLVLAAGQSITQLEGKDKPKMFQTVTLLVSPEEAERLALASKMGTLLLALRRSGDNNIVMTSGLLPMNVWGIVDTKGVPLAVIELIQGGVRTRVQVEEPSPAEETEPAKDDAGEEVKKIAIEEKGKRGAVPLAKKD